MPGDVPASSEADWVEPSGAVFHNTFEVWRLSDGERMGMLGSNLLFDVHQNFRLGVGTYGALTGNRGGFITLGFAAEARQELSENWQLNGGCSSALEVVREDSSLPVADSCSGHRVG